MLEKTGIAAILDLSGWASNLKTYLSDLNAINAAEKAAAAQSGKALGSMARAAGGAANTTAQMHGVLSKAIQQTGQKSDFAATMASKFEGSMRQLYNAVYPLPGTLGRMARAFSRAGMSIGSFMQKLSGLSSTAMATVAAIGALVAAVGALIYFGRRGAGYKGLAEGFGLAAQKAGVLADVLLKDLRQASRGTVRDIDLMRQANMAFAGTTGALAKALGEGGLAGLMKVARAQARVTGQDVNYLFESLVLGVKRLQPRLIDNTALQIRTQEAYEALARSLHKNVDALTTEERQVAVLNATLKAGKDAVDRFSDSQLTAQERSQQLKASWQNMMDTLAVAAQPAYEFMLAIGNAIMETVEPAVRALATVMYELGDATFGVALRAMQKLGKWLKEAFAPLVGLTHKWLLVLVGAIRFAGRAFEGLNEAAVQTIRPLLKNIGLINRAIALALDPKIIGYYSGRAMAAMGTGILKAANDYVFPAVITIAEFISAFLMGHSPPPEGPLHLIDEGGAAVMRAWLSGFVGVTLEPVAQVAARVDRALGAIGRMTLDQVGARLKQIEEYLQPYRDWLDIVKARLDSINALLDVFARRTKLALKRFMSGEMSVDQMRMFDRQTQSARQLSEAYQEAATSAEIQLRLAESRFSVERVLLEIQKRRLEGAEGEEESIKKATKAASRAAKTMQDMTPSGGALTNLEDEGGLAALLGLSGEKADAAFAEFTGSFLEGLLGDPGFLKETMRATENMDKLYAAMSGGGESTWAKRLADIFGPAATGPLKEYKTLFQDTFSLDLPGVLWDFSILAGGYLAKDGTITSLFSGFSLEPFTGTFHTGLGKGGSVNKTLDEFGDSMSKFFKWEKGGTLYDLITEAGDSVGKALDGAFKTAAQLMVDALWAGLEAIAGLWNDTIKALADAAGSVPGAGSWLKSQLEGLTIDIGEKPVLYGGGQEARGFGGGEYSPWWRAPWEMGSGQQREASVHITQEFNGTVSSDDAYSAAREAALSMGYGW